MTITFQCEYCGKRIKAPDEAGGKRSKCPACQNSIYVPGQEPDEELKLAPVDNTTLEEQRRLMAETRSIEQDILSETNVPAASSEELAAAEVPAAYIPTPGTSDMDSEDLMKNIIAYLRQMADGQLEEAEIIAKSIIPAGDKVLKLLDDIALSDIPEPELSDIPQQILSGLIRTLRDKIS